MENTASHRSALVANGNLTLENKYITLTLGKDGYLVSAVEKATGIDRVTDDKTPFIWAYNGNVDWKEAAPVYPESFRYEQLTPAVAVIYALYGGEEVAVKATAREDYFVFELLTGLPSMFEHIFFVCLHVSDADDYMANGVAMTLSTHPTFFPNRSNGKVMGRAMALCNPVGSVLAAAFAPYPEQKELIREIFNDIDPDKGIVSHVGGVWSQECADTHTDYVIVSSMDPATYKTDTLDAYKQYKDYGVDMLDFHQGLGYRQGDFTFFRPGGPENFKKEIADVAETYGIHSSLHTYSMYLAYDACDLLSDPRWLPDLDTKERMTLEEDISESDTRIKTVEDAGVISTYFGFCFNNSPFILIDDELIKFTVKDGVFVSCERGMAGTKAARHKKGAIVDHVVGHYHGFAPRPESPLFYEVARRTADTFNKGGFTMIYLDALDGYSRNCPAGTYWYHEAVFVHAILRRANKYPVFEYSTLTPCIWAARGKVGAWDTPYRDYKNWNRRHADSNRLNLRSYNTAMLGWYNFYPTTDNYPGNLHTKYQYFDDIDAMACLALAYDYAIVFNPLPFWETENIPALRRNLELYGKYSAVRKARITPEKTLEALRDYHREFKMITKADGTPGFVEMSYKRKKIYDTLDGERNTYTLVNPFKAQKPFIRIESLLSTLGTSPLTLFHFDEEKELREQPLTVTFENEINVKDRLALRVRLYGNNSGDAVCVRLRCATNSEKGLGDYVIPMDFEGWREFELIETENGELGEYKFDKSAGLYEIGRSSLNHDRLTSVEIYLSGECKGVRMSDIVATTHIYNPIKNPTVKVGDESVTFICELNSTDYLEYDGEKAVVYDRYGYAKPVPNVKDGLTFNGGEQQVTFTAEPLSGARGRAILTFGFTGEEV